VLVEKGLISERKDSEDQRKRLLQLTAKGLQLVEQMEPLWEKIKEANNQLLQESSDLLISLDAVEKALDDQSMHDRIVS
jgi:DNA-binding MarR family transcriptional regulator